MPLDKSKIKRLRSDVPALRNQIYVNWGWRRAIIEIDSS